MSISYARSVLKNVKDTPRGLMASCVAHPDRNPSMEVWLDDDGRVAAHCYAGCRHADVMAGLRALGIDTARPSGTRSRPDPRPAPVERDAKPTAKAKPPKPWRGTPTYPYVRGGVVQFGVVRFTNRKGFFQVRPDGKGGWYTGLGDVEPFLYHVDDIPAAVERGDVVLVCEGEKDADNGRGLGFTATTSPMGAGKWRDEYSEDLRGARVAIMEDNDEPGRAHAAQVAKSLHGIAASIKIITFRDMPEKADLTDWIEAGGTAEELRAMIEAAPEWTPPADPKTEGGERRALDYVARDNGIYRIRYTSDGAATYIPLCNFDAEIKAQVTRDDGAERSVVFIIEGQQNGRALPRIEVPAERFTSMAWPVGEWGAGCVVLAGQGAKDHARAAIQLLSKDVEERTVYGHTGWRQIGDKWLYLHAGGAIGADNTRADVAVHLEHRLQHISLPEPPTGDELKRAIKASFGIRSVAPDKIAVPLLAATYRAALNEILPPDMAPGAVGQTGAQKTAMAALAQAHYGADFNGDFLPGHWEGTANALERLAFVAKDALLVVDDFAPTGSVNDIQRRHKDADRLLRSAANRGGRPRMRPDGTLRPELYARALIHSTGEDLPAGSSLRARMFVTEYQRGDVSLPELTKAQQDAAAGLYAAAMAGYVQWLAGHFDRLKDSLPKRMADLRQAARQAVTAYHDRTPSNVASLAVGWEVALSYALDAGAIDKAEAADSWAAGWDALLEVAAGQADHIHAEDPVNRFILLLDAALTSGAAHLADQHTGGVPAEPTRRGWRREAGGYEPRGARIGWADGEGNIYLQQDAAFATIQRYARDQNTNLPITQRTLWKQMSEGGKLASKDDKRYTARVEIEGRRIRVIHIHHSVLYPAESGPSGPSGPQPHNHAVSRPCFVVHSLKKVDQKLGQSGPDENSMLGRGPVVDQFGPLVAHSTNKVGQAETRSTTDFDSGLVHLVHSTDREIATGRNEAAAMAEHEWVEI